MSLRDHLLSQSVTSEKVSLPQWAHPEWGDTYLVRGLTALEHYQFEVKVLNNKKAADSSPFAWVTVRCLLDLSGNPVFTTDDEKAVEQMGSACPIKVFTTAMALSNMAPSQIEELAKN